MSIADPMNQKLEELLKLHDEAERVGSDELRVASLSGIYDLIFQDVELTKKMLRGTASIIQEVYNKKGNPKEVKYLKKVARGIFRNLCIKREMLLELDKIINREYGLE